MISSSGIECNLGRKALRSFAAVLILLGALVAYGAPGTISIQGKLTGPTGKPLTGTRVWRVQFYDAAVSGSPLGTALTGSVGVAASGRFTIELTPPAPALAATGALYYELAIDSAATPDGVINLSDVFPGRVKVTSVMYAQNLVGTVTDAQVPDNITINFARTAGTATTATTALTAAEHDTLASVTARGGTTAVPMTVNNLIDSTNSANGALTVAGGLGVGKTLNVAGDLYYRGSRAFAWQVATTNTQAAANNGYLADHPTKTVVVTLPTTPTLKATDIVRVSGKGAGGWKVAQNAGERILLQDLNAFAVTTWTARLKDTNAGWGAIAVTPDGSKAIAGTEGGNIFTSTDGGATWTARASARSWYGVAISADGTRMAGADSFSCLYTSNDGGATWTPRMNDVNRSWISVAMTPDGTKMAAAVQGGFIYTSSDGGATWIPRMNDTPRSWRAIAMSDDGLRMAAVGISGYVYTTSDGGTTWNPSFTDTSRDWRMVAVSPDGLRMVTGVYGGFLYISTDGGMTWTPRLTDMNRNWRCVALSRDGSRIAAGSTSGLAGSGNIHLSNDGGITWSTMMTDAVRSWRGMGMSADGTKVIAGYYGDFNGNWLYTSAGCFLSQTTLGPAGFLSGGPGSAVEIQYLGNGVFMPLSHNGLLSAK